MVGDWFVLGMAGQVAYHLMAQAEVARAPWPVTTIVSCLPVLVLAMGTALAHMLRADAEAPDAPDSGAGPWAILRSLAWSSEDQGRPDDRGPKAGPDRSARPKFPPSRWVHAYAQLVAPLITEITCLRSHELRLFLLVKAHMGSSPGGTTG